MAWTIQQQYAIDARDCSVIVSAAAGSGKTAVLTERLVQLLADPSSGVRADRIIVVTFTNDAAAELKKRLDQKLRKLINTDPSNKHLLRQQVLLQSAKISTINAFCFDLLRDNITDQGITSGFGVLDDADEKVLLSRAMDDLIAWMTDNDYDALSKLYDRFCINKMDTLTEVIKDMDNFLGSVAMPEKYLDSLAEEYRNPFEKTSYYRTLVKSVREMLLKAKPLAEKCLDMTEDIFPEIIPGKASGKLKDKAQDDADRLDAALSVLDTGRMLNDDEVKKLGDFIPLRSLGKAEYDPEAYELYKARRDELKAAVKAAAAVSQSVESDFSESAEVTEYLVRAVRKYRELIWERKCRKNAISFADGERLVLELLAEEEDGKILQTETAKRIADFYDIIMIDEYQDSNNKQDLIFKLLSKDYRLSEDGEPMYGSNAFLVGDVKQSIYGFRLANPGNFISTMKRSEPYTPEHTSKNCSIVLNKNFRSSPEVIDFVNYVFTRIMDGTVGGLAYTDEEKLYFGAEYYAPADKERRTHISFIVKDEDSEKLEPEAEARAVARKIAEMIRSGVLVTADDKGNKRPCRPSDFCILVRNNDPTRLYARELMAQGIPAEGSEEKGYLKSREITILIDLLRVISNPLQDIPLAAVMTSPMFMFSIGELAQIRAFNKKGSLYSVLREVAGDHSEEFGDVFLSTRVREMLTAIDRFRLDSVTMTISELIRSIYDATDFISVMQLTGDGEKKRANLRALIQYARGYEESTAFEGTGGLSSFLRFIDRLVKTGKKGDYAQGKVAQASGDYVSVQTLHGSKGLEYPFVFIAENSTSFKFDSDTMMCSADGRVGYILYDPETVQRYKTFQHNMLTEERRASARSEEMRLFYVGLTRAKQQLFITLRCGPGEMKYLEAALRQTRVRNDDTLLMVSGAACYAHWLWSCIFLHSQFPEIAGKIGLSQGEFGYPSPKETADLFTWDVVCPDETVIAEEQADLPEAMPDEELCEKIRELIDLPYDKVLAETPARLSVTQLTHKAERAPDLRLQRPRFITGRQALTGAERGTAIHTFFQYCDFLSAMADPEAEISRIAGLGYLTDAEAESIDRGKTAAFFRSSLYNRISSADRVWREKKFMAAAAELDMDDPVLDKLRSAGGMIKGIIDLMFEEDGEIFIVDYKSDRGASPEKLRERYTMQLRLYKAAVELTTGMKVKGASLYSFEMEKEIPLEV